MSDHRTKDWCEKHNWCFRHKSPRTRFWCPECIDEYETRVATLEAALDDAILAIEHAAHPVASQWLPKLRKVRGNP
jgi:hypothetical protein